MSEFQLYRFKTIDRPLTNDEQEEVRSWSSRAEITSTSAFLPYSCKCVINCNAISNFLLSFNLQHSIPTFPLPLQSEDMDVSVELQALLNQVYDRAGYDLAIDYTADPIPPFSTEDGVWADTILKKAQLR